MVCEHAQDLLNHLEKEHDFVEQTSRYSQEAVRHLSYAQQEHTVLKQELEQAKGETENKQNDNVALQSALLTMIDIANSQYLDF